MSNPFVVPAQSISFTLTAVAVNNVPTVPTVTAPASGNTNTPLAFTPTATDPDNDTLRYAFDWDNDGTVDEYAPSAGFVASGTAQTLNHSWINPGTYPYQVRTEDNKGGVSGWTAKSITISVLPGCGTVFDADGNLYDTVLIGSQCWMKQNMNVGTRINAATAQTNNSVIEKYCYDDQDANCTTNHPTYPDGGLYTWDEAMQYSTTAGAQGICPAGWHIPTDVEWRTLENSLKDAGQTCDGNRTGYDCASAGTKLKPGGSSGFEGNLSGDYFVTGSFLNRDAAGYFWSSSENGVTAWYRMVNSSESRVMRVRFFKTNSLSVRCVQGGAANVAPLAPTLSVAPATGNVNTAVSFTATGTDPDGDTLRYLFDWNNNGIADAGDDWIPAPTGMTVNYVVSGTPGTVSHTWTTGGNQTFRVYAQDQKGAMSTTWATHTITISASTLKLCANSCASASPYDTAYLASFSVVPITLTACLGTGSCNGDDTAVSGTWTANNTPSDAVSISTTSGSSTTITGTYSGSGTASEDIVFNDGTHPDITARASVSCTPTTTCATEGKNYCQGQAFTIANNGCNQSPSCTGTRNCDTNWHEVAP